MIFPRPATVCLSLVFFIPALAEPPQLRQPNPALNVPAEPPPAALSLVDAFPGLTFDAPTCIASPPAPTTQLFVCEKGGKIWLIPDVNAPTQLLFMDLGVVVNARTGVERFRTVDECGFCGLAFHPNYAANRQFYVSYSPGLGTGSTPPLYQRLSRFTRHSANPNAADTASESILFQLRDEQAQHQAGDLHFGPDGYLYMSIGDEGGQNDRCFNAQRIDKDFYSGILRFDVDKKPGNHEPSPHPNPADYPTSPPPDAVQRDNGIARYSIPADNPFIGATTFNGMPVATNYVRTEFWAVGLRNPWRISFDGNDLWVGDVGGARREEINRVTKGGNYGWVYREGYIEGPWDDSTPSHEPAPAGFNPIAPLYAYEHGSSTFEGNAIIGGHIYRGSTVSSLIGKYLFADHLSGHLWSINPDGSDVTRIAGESGISCFGKNPRNQETLIGDHDNDRVLKLSVTGTSGSFPATLSATGLFSNTANLTPAPGLIPYAVNLPFWSDHAIKQRWFTPPDADTTFAWSKDGLWTLPSGTIWVKHFDMEMQRGVPASKKRIETRLLVKNAAGAYGVSYRWNTGGTDATLVVDQGESFTLNVTQNGNPVPQTWMIPSRAQCQACHTPQAGHALSFNTRQLNLTNDILGHTGNQLATLFNQGYFSNNPGSPNLLPRHLRPDETGFPVEARVRSYFAVNCSYCHRSGGTAPQWDGRSELTLTQTGLVNGAATNNGGNPANKLVVPGDTAHSIVLNRVAVTNGFTRMPPLGSTVVDAANVALLTIWINGELDDRVTYDDWRSSHFEPDNDLAGEPGEDPDGDGSTNHDEFLAATHPHDGTSFLHPQLSVDPLKLSFPLPMNRSFRIGVSQNLNEWLPCDVPGNQGLPVAGGLVEVLLPLSAPRNFFRIEITEN